MANRIRLILVFLIIITIPVKAQTTKETNKKSARQTKKPPIEAVIPTEKPMLIDSKSGIDTLTLNDRIGIRTNAADWLMLIPNIGIEFDLKNVNYNRNTLGINIRYNWQTSHTYNPGTLYNIAEARIDYRNYFRVKTIDKDSRNWKYNRHKHIWDKPFSARHKTSKHPNAMFYRGAYLAFTKYSMMLGNDGKQGTAISAGYQFGIVKPLYVFRNGHSLDLDLGVAIGVTYTSYDKYRLDRESNCYPTTGHADGQIMPMINELRCALTYRLGKTPSTSKYRWRYEVDTKYQEKHDNIHFTKVAHDIDVRNTDSIQGLIRKEFWAVYDSLLTIERANTDSLNKIKVREQKAQAALLKSQKAINRKMKKQTGNEGKAGKKENQKKQTGWKNDSIMSEKENKTEIGIKTKERESKKNKETKKDKSGSETSSNDKNQSASTEPIISATEERKEDRP